MWDHWPEWFKKDVELDENHILQWTYIEGEKEPAGCLFAHHKPGGGWCIGGFQWKPRQPGPLWELHSLEPLHVEPSILCHTCGEHGFIRDGKWIPC